MSGKDIDIVDVRRQIVADLTNRRYTPSGSDPSDFQQGADRSLRFKTGTQYGEVTVTAWNYSRCVGTFRATKDSHLPDVIRWINRLIEEKAERQRVPIKEYKP